jgi:Sulfotransferase domain
MDLFLNKLSYQNYVKLSLVILSSIQFDSLVSNNKNLVKLMYLPLIFDMKRYVYSLQYVNSLSNWKKLHLFVHCKIMFQVKQLHDKLTKSIETEVVFDSIQIIDLESQNYCVLFQKEIPQFLEKIKKLKVYEDDIWVVTFPKTGTTWTQEMVWLLNNDLDYETALKIKQMERFPYLE